MKVLYRPIQKGNFLECFILLTSYETFYSNSLYDWAMNPLKKNQEEEEEIVRKEKLIEKDDPEELDRLRKQDEWKDGKA